MPSERDTVDLPIGLYELLVTSFIDGQIKELDQQYHVGETAFRDAEVADRISYHLANLIEKSVAALPSTDRAKAGIALANNVIETLRTEDRSNKLDLFSLAEPGRVLQSISASLPDGRERKLNEPLIPLLDTALLTNAPGEPRLSGQLKSEVDSADQIDLVMAFIRQSGISPLLESLRRHCEQGKSLRVLTSTYTGTTEAAALDLLKEAGAKVRVSYDVTGTRLHAKSWLFGRNSGFPTAYIGSSNLTHQAQVTGLEWNIRISGARNPSVIDKITAVFESYWNSRDFEEYDRQSFQDKTKSTRKDANLVISPIEIRLHPFQERLLEKISIARSKGRIRNLLVAATGTGKTVMAAVDYTRLSESYPNARLLFVAHRKEILTQARNTFCHALRDANFGELWVDGQKPENFNHVFASIQTLNTNNLKYLEADHFDIVIIDEFHHAAANSYTRLLDFLKPKQLLGLTATPERADGQTVLTWFDNRIAAEMRLWDAIDQNRLVPFNYFGIFDGTDLTKVSWKRGRGYDLNELSNVLTSDDLKGRMILQELRRRMPDLSTLKALGFCVSVKHARFMARVFSEAGIKSKAVWAETPTNERESLVEDLTTGKIQIIFSVDLFNEGVDIPPVDTLLLLRPTESGTLFLQQLGRGLRKHQHKAVCTVLDFVGLHRSEFRYDRKFRALLGGTRDSIQKHVESDFPFLPAGCDLQLDQKSRDIIIRSIKQAIPSTWPTKVTELREIYAANNNQAPSLSQFLEMSGLELEDIYKSTHSWSELCEDAGIAVKPAGTHEKLLRNAVGRILHINDERRISAYQHLLNPEYLIDKSINSKELVKFKRMLSVSLLSQVINKEKELDSPNKGWQKILEHPQVCDELTQLLDVLLEQTDHLNHSIDQIPDCPLQVHGSYTRLEILAATMQGKQNEISVKQWREGCLWAKDEKADLLAFTLDKTDGAFSPTTRYKDYAISRELMHWESQSTTADTSETGNRYQRHATLGTSILLFARRQTSDRDFLFLGPATYVSHLSSRPMGITWRLAHPLPGDVYAEFAAAVA